MKKICLLGLITLASCAGPRVAAQRAGAAAPHVATVDQNNHITIGFSDLSRPGLLRVNLTAGSLSVKAYAGKEVIIDAEPRVPRIKPIEAANLRRIDDGLADLRVEGQGNVVTVRTDGFYRAARINIQVPTKTNLELVSVNGGLIDVDGVEGDIDIQNTNGGVRASDVSGSVRADATNGAVVVAMRGVTPGKALSFTTVNGRVDVTLPPSIKANAQMRTSHGGIWTDFDIQQTSTNPAVQDLGNGYRRYQIESDIRGTINGGGPQVTLSTMNGNIFIRKGR
jgi:hypothetical protein